MKLIIGTDHRGLELKKNIVNILENEYEIIDLSSEEQDYYDYPDYAFKVCNHVLNDTENLGVLICGTGIGMSIAANKVKGIRCALVHDKEEACLAREHNNANIIAFSSKIDVSSAVSYIDAFVNSKFSDEEKHHRRVNKIISYECGTYDEL